MKEFIIVILLYKKIILSMEITLFDVKLIAIKLHSILYVKLPHLYLIFHAFTIMSTSFIH